LLLINIGLGLQDRVENLTATAFAETIDRELRRPAGIYALDLPVKVLEVLETMDEGICFEREVEGRQVTPDWFPRQLAARAAASLVRKAVDLLLQEIQARVAERAREAAGGKEHAVAAAVVQGGLEFCNKTEHQAAGYKRAIEQLTELRRVKDEFWPPDPPDWRSQVSSQERWLVALLANLTPSLAATSRENDEPDWFGQPTPSWSSGCFVLCGTETRSFLRGSSQRSSMRPSLRVIESLPSWESGTGMCCSPS
jgi:hypothetical protein